MDLISRISQHFTDSARTKLDAVELLAAPIAGAVELMVGALVGNGKIWPVAMGGRPPMPSILPPNWWGASRWNARGWLPSP